MHGAAGGRHPAAAKPPFCIMQYQYPYHLIRWYSSDDVQLALRNYVCFTMPRGTPALSAKPPVYIILVERQMRQGGLVLAAGRVRLKKKKKKKNELPPHP